jgi:hypothetical protein
VGEAALLLLLTVLLSFPGQRRESSSFDSFVDHQELGRLDVSGLVTQDRRNLEPDITQSYRDQKGRHNNNTVTQIGTMGKLGNSLFWSDCDTITT